MTTNTTCTVIIHASTTFEQTTWPPPELPLQPVVIQNFTIHPATGNSITSLRQFPTRTPSGSVRYSTHIFACGRLAFLLYLHHLPRELSTERQSEFANQSWHLVLLGQGGRLTSRDEVRPFASWWCNPGQLWLQLRRSSSRALGLTAISILHSKRGSGPVGKTHVKAPPSMKEMGSPCEQYRCQGLEASCSGPCLQRGGRLPTLIADC